MTAPKGLGFGTYNDIQLGMSSTEVSQRGYRLTMPGTGDGCITYTATAPSGESLAVGFTAKSKRLSTIAAPTGAGTALVPHDPTTETQLRAAYPTAAITRLTTTGMVQKTFTIVTQPNTSGQLYFTTDSAGRLTAPMTAPRVPIGCPDPVTTAPATTSTADAPTLGTVWAPNQKGYGEVRPTDVYNGGDPTGIVDNITWSSWGGSTATGSGTGIYVPDGGYVAQGKQTPATIVAFNLGQCQGRLMYQAIEWYFPSKGESFNPNSYINICTGDYVH
ncbi:hypothetical protein HH308_28115 [Gordonia sp. TBRC 11910]|uniref:Uncharacterized protein n=1 Tax=Gordonia asplenii TaxID=2725283 RepID=A0A848L8L1_9ACTN|nr:hypothetical protein [Gordonia asplenii]NMO05093.1 hypothetical protein [Gordonia asplenii]